MRDDADAATRPFRGAWPPARAPQDATSRTLVECADRGNLERNETESRERVKGAGDPRRGARTLCASPRARLVGGSERARVGRARIRIEVRRQSVR